MPSRHGVEIKVYFYISFFTLALGGVGVQCLPIYGLFVPIKKPLAHYNRAWN
jgi:hypothetical protein